ncbi:GGDEF domain-containing protein [Kribbella sp. NBC_01245]|uniref:GGDEF domain-containing protein n=1 Tax=Kribbella sp. NBC_01245 TaxID=2903578 RepID=UPI002E296954|nr:GGDEF domain-containing protein [Kribbella sp. NBC_01245]
MPTAVLAYVLAVDLLAASAVGVSIRLVGIDSADLVRLAILAVGSAVHVEAARGIERLREVGAEGVPYTNLKGMWTFAGALLLPPPLAVVLIMSTYVHSWFRLRRVPPYRWIFSAATIVLATSAAALVLFALSPAGYPGYPSGPLGLVAIALAGLTYWFVNYALVVGAIMLSSPTTPAGQALGRLSDQLIVAGSLGLGVAIAALLIHEPWSVTVLLLTVLGLHRALLVGQFQTAAQKDPKTGLANAAFWFEMANKEFDRAKRTGSSLGVLYVDLDHFKAVNDTHGHRAGDEALKAVADALGDDVRTDDLVGRLGGEEFAILLPATSPAETKQTAERIRHRVSGLTITVTGLTGPVQLEHLTCSIGIASYPENGTTMDALMLAADTATYAAKDAGRDQVVAAPMPDTPS